MAADITEQLKQYDDDRRKQMDDKINKLTGEVDTVSNELRDSQKQLGKIVSSQQFNNLLFKKERAQRKMGEIQFSIKQSTDELVQLNKSVVAYQEIRESPGVIGLLGELIDVQPQLYIAVENALGSQLCNIVVDTQEHGMQAIEKLKQINKPEFASLRVNFLILKDFENSPAQPASF